MEDAFNSTMVDASLAEGSREVINLAAAPIKVPAFWPQKVALWFHQLEAQFAIARITKDETKFGYVVAQLEGKHAEEVEDIICNPPAAKKYDTIKAELIKRLSDSDTTRVRKLLEAEEMGDRTPTQFWRRLKELVGSAVNEEFLVEMWKNRLPTKMQLVLAATSDKDGAKLAEIADRVHEIPVARERVAATSQSSEIDTLRDELNKMSARLEALLNDRERPRRRSVSRDRRGNRPRSKSRDKQKPLCWYHYRHAERAARCIPPCKWAGPKPGNE
ncbi:uncharacterized protein LOC143432188 [Xylocopa sonorina]|uniref:uncharacterized protein LOC143432188 n=1 Tax=Xylocopa sonorina TaxID=1818115 RepID=UPI00403ACDFF